MTNLTISIIAKSTDVYKFTELSNRAFNLFQKSTVKVNTIGKTIVAEYKYDSVSNETIEYVMSELNRAFVKRNLKANVVEGTATFTDNDGHKTIISKGKKIWA